jgi:hypothetical protein
MKKTKQGGMEKRGVIEEGRTPPEPDHLDENKTASTDKDDRLEDGLLRRLADTVEDGLG